MMIQEESLKQLLLKDLCARVPYYGLFCQTNKGKGTLISAECSFGEALVYVDFGYQQVEEFDLDKDDVVKPYLRPMSSMTEEEKVEWFESVVPTMDCDKQLDFYCKHHFDYRGLIPRGLAFEAPEDMYKIK